MLIKYSDLEWDGRSNTSNAFSLSNQRYPVFLFWLTKTGKNILAILRNKNRKYISLENICIYTSFKTASKSGFGCTRCPLEHEWMSRCAPIHHQNKRQSQKRWSHCVAAQNQQHKWLQDPTLNTRPLHIQNLQYFIILLYHVPKHLNYSKNDQ